MKNKSLTKTQQEAALLIAQSELSNIEICQKLDVPYRTLYNWKNLAAFQKAIAEHVEEIVSELRHQAIRSKARRILFLEDRRRRMQRIIEERANDPDMADVPGGKTGMIVHNVKAIGAGALAERVDLYEFDAALSKEMRETEKQAAIELGQLPEKHEHSGIDGGPIVVAGFDLKKLDVDQLRQLREIRNAATVTDDRSTSDN